MENGKKKTTLPEQTDASTESVTQIYYFSYDENYYQGTEMGSPVIYM